MEKITKVVKISDKICEKVKKIDLVMKIIDKCLKSTPTKLKTMTPIGKIAKSNRLLLLLLLEVGKYALTHLWDHIKSANYLLLLLLGKMAGNLKLWINWILVI